LGLAGEFEGGRLFLNYGGCQMGLLSYLKGFFGRPSIKNNLYPNQRGHLYDILIEDENNPALHYLIDTYSLNVAPFSKVADLIIEVAIASALKLAEANSKKVNNNIIHFFYDLYLCLNSKLFSQDEGIASAIVDGMHIKYFGQPSLKVITSLFQLRAEKENCFLVSFFSIAKTPDFFRILGNFSAYYLSNESVGVTECLFNSEVILEIIKHVSEKLRNEIEVIIKD
jgi:hypothetical protein